MAALLAPKNLEQGLVEGAAETKFVAQCLEVTHSIRRVPPSPAQLASSL